MTIRKFVFVLVVLVYAVYAVWFLLRCWFWQ